MSDIGAFGSAAKRALSSYVAYNLINYALGFGFQILLVKSLATSEYASYMVLLALLFSLDSILSLGVDRTIKRFLPILIHDRDWRGLRHLGQRLALVRAGTIVAFVLGLWVGRDLLGDLLPVGSSTELLIAFGVWFVGYKVFDDMVCITQGLVEHGMSVLTTTVELVLRIGAVVVLVVAVPDASATEIVGICAVTFGVTSLALALRLYGRFVTLIAATATPAEAAHTGDVGDEGGEGANRRALEHVPGFMAAAYGSTLGWMISNPSMVRLVASAGLQVTVLAAFSFLQALAGALQRIFPGLLILPVLEPILAGMSVRGREGHAVSALSFIFKLDLIILLGGTIGLAIAGREVVALLSQPEYADFYPILFVLFGSMMLNTVYRVFEIRAALVFKQKIFLFLWPFGLVSLGLIYLTVDRWGLTAVLLWPFLENLARIIVLLIVFRNDEIWRTFDPPRAVLLAASATAVGLATFGAGWLLGIDTGIPRILLGVAGATVFAVSALVVRPFRPAEIELVTRMLPGSFGRLHGIFSRLASPASAETGH